MTKKAVATTGAQALAAQQQSMADRLRGIGGGGVGIISVENKTFQLPNQELVPRELPIVVLDWAFHNAYFDEPYVPGKPTRPACFAVGQNSHLLTPSVNSPRIQNEGNPCATCWANQFSSGVGRAKACKNQIRVACMLPDEGPEGDILLIKISPTGLRPFREYAEKINARGFALVQVVTIAGFDMGSKYDTLRFTADGPASKKHKENVMAYAERIPEATEILLREPKFDDDDE